MADRRCGELALSKSGARLIEMVCFDVGTTLLDETPSWLAWATWLKVSPAQLRAAVRESIALGELQPKRSAVERLRPGVNFEKARNELEGPTGRSIFKIGDLLPDVWPTVRQLQEAGFRRAAAGNLRVETACLLGECGCRWSS
jgi:hypothetical protein